MQKVSKNKFVSIVLIVFFVFGLFTFNTFEPASAYTGTITYDSGTNTITCVGGSSSTPISFNDIYEADLADNSWNVTFINGNSQYYFNAKINIGNPTIRSYFYDKAVTVSFGNQAITGNWQNFITVINTNITMGIMNDISTKSTSQTVLLINECTFSGIGYMHLTNCKIEFNSLNVLQNGNLDQYSCFLFYNTNINSYWYNSILPDYCNLKIYNNPLDFYNVQWFNTPSNGAYGLLASNINAENLLMNNVYVPIVYGVDSNFTNCRFINNNYLILNANPTKYSEYDIRPIHFIDCYSDSWNFTWTSSANDNIYRDYTFNLNVLNGNITDFVENATVQLWKDSNLVYEGYTNSSGMIPTQTLTYGFYQQSTGNTIQNATSPYYLIITHPDWQTYISRFYITEPLRLTVSMQEPTHTDFWIYIFLTFIILIPSSIGYLLLRRKR